MKSMSIHRRSGGICAAVFAALSLTSSAQTVTVDGIREDSNAEGYTLLHTQTTQSKWADPNRSLANLYAKQEGGSLFYHLASKAAGGAVILFLDTKPGGVNFIPNNLITSGGEETYINSLGSSATAGLTFETGFAADYAIRIFGDGTNAYVNIYNLTTGVRTYAGNSGGTSISSGIVTEMKTIWGDYVLAEYAAASLGVEIKLSMAALGVPTGTQVVKATALMVDGNSTYASNQVLGSRTGSTLDIGNDIKAINFETEAGTQTLSFTVNNTDSDGDGIPDNIDPDDDNDGLPDTVETNTGTYVSSSNTGTNPLIADTDGDGYSDYDEVNSTLGYLSNPNIPNYTAMTVPGSFNLPTAWTADSGANTPSTDMTQGSTASLTEQYSWKLDYKFSTLGAIEYKFAAGSWATNWGNGGGNFAGTIQATGIHTFTFNNATLAQSLTRTVFANSAAFLAAYGLSGSPSGDADGDGVSNVNEFAANTDPTNADTDGDLLGDANDPQPLIAAAASRDIVFSVNMTVQQALGTFNPGSGSVVVKFFSGVMAGQPDLSLTDGNADGIYTGTLSAVSGPVGGSFGTYKFFNATAGAPNGGYEDGADRTFNLAAGNATQTLPVVYFSNNSTMPAGYGSWATANAGGQASSQDFDGDGVKNGVEYFMGQTGSTFTPNPSPVGGIVSWPRSTTATGVTFKVWSSGDLSIWADVTAGADTSDPAFVKYTVPTGAGKKFVRLEVTTTP